MMLHDLLKQLVFAGVALAVSAALWSAFMNEYTAKVAESIKKQKPMEFKFDSKSVIWTPPTINMNSFQPKSSGSKSKTGR